MGTRDPSPYYGNARAIEIHPVVEFARHRLCERNRQWCEEAIAELYYLAHPERGPNFYR